VPSSLGGAALGTRRVVAGAVCVGGVGGVAGLTVARLGAGLQCGLHLFPVAGDLPHRMRHHRSGSEVGVLPHAVNR
jgi:hypothetical protein